MSLVVAIKDGDKIVMGSDSKISSSNLYNDNAIKIWEVKGSRGSVLMGGVGTYSTIQSIMYDNAFLPVDNKNVDTGYVVKTMFPTMLDVLRTNCKLEDKDTTIDGSFIYAVDDKMWRIYNDGCVREGEKYLVMGSGEEIAIGALYATERTNMNAEERIRMAIWAAAENTLYVNNDVVIMETTPKPQTENMEFMATDDVDDAEFDDDCLGDYVVSKTAKSSNDKTDDYKDKLISQLIALLEEEEEEEA